jgi:hypothetical protein
MAESNVTITKPDDNTLVVTITADVTDLMAQVGVDGRHVMKQCFDRVQELLTAKVVKAMTAQQDAKQKAAAIKAIEDQQAELAKKLAEMDVQDATVAAVAEAFNAKEEARKKAEKDKN